MAACSSAIVVAFVGLVGFVQPAAAQALGQAFVYGGPTVLFERGAPPLATFGGGGDVLAGNGGGASVEFGLLGIGGAWVSQVSVDAMYQKAPSAKSRLSPFVLGGYTGFFSSYGGAHGINFGGGTNVWMSPRLAIRIEARDHVLPSEGAVQAFAVRFGVTIR